MCILNDGFVKSPSAAFRFIRHSARLELSAGFARLAYGSFFCAVYWMTFCGFIKYNVSLFLRLEV
jgi:hypothetical protein